GAGEVSPLHSSWEAGERRRATEVGAGGAKGGGRGEHGTSQHAPDPEPGKRVPWTGPCTDSCKAGWEGTVHRAPPPCRCRASSQRLLLAEAGCGARCRRRDMAGI